MAADNEEDFGAAQVKTLSLEDDGDQEDMAQVNAAKAKLAAAPNNDQLHAELARALADVGREDEAVAAFDAALKIKPNHVPYMEGKAKVLVAAGQTEEARAVLQAALAVDANNANVLFALGKAHQLDEEHVKAKACFNEVIAANPNHAAALFELGSYASNTGDQKSNMDEAIGFYKRSAEADPTNIKCLKNLGQLLQTKGDLKGAAGYFERASHVDTADVQLRAKVIQCYDQLNMEAEREKVRAKLHDDYKAGVLNRNYTAVGRYNCGQFEVGDKFVMAWDHFAAPNATAKYTFYIYKKGKVHEDNVLAKVTLVPEGGKYVLKVQEKPAHTFDNLPPYSAVKAEVVKIAGTVVA
jgi:tetratricopeptide (TPR) repeat protein